MTPELAQACKATPKHPRASAVRAATVLVALLTAGGCAQTQDMRWPGPCTETVRDSDGKLIYHNVFRYTADGALTELASYFYRDKTQQYENFRTDVRITPFTEKGKSYTQVAMYDASRLDNDDGFFVIRSRTYTASQQLVRDMLAIQHRGPEERSTCLETMSQSASLPRLACRYVVGSTRRWLEPTLYRREDHDSRYPRYGHSVVVGEREVRFDFQNPAPHPNGRLRYAACQEVLAGSEFKKYMKIPARGGIKACAIPSGFREQVDPQTVRDVSYFYVRGTARSRLITSDHHQNPTFIEERRHAEAFDDLGQNDDRRLEMERAYEVVFKGAPLGPSTLARTTAYTYGCWNAEQHNTPQVRDTWRPPDGFASDPWWLFLDHFHSH